MESITLVLFSQHLYFVDKIKDSKEINIVQPTPKKKGRLTNVGGKGKKPKTMVSKKQFFFSKSNEKNAMVWSERFWIGHFVCNLKINGFKIFRECQKKGMWFFYNFPKVKLQLRPLKPQTIGLGQCSHLSFPPSWPLFIEVQPQSFGEERPTPQPFVFLSSSYLLDCFQVLFIYCY